MGTRSGDLDPGVIGFLERDGMTSAQVDEMLNKKSGLLGLSGVSSDMREVLTAADQGNRRALLALKAFCYRVRKHIGAYVASLGGLDAVIFTGGIGENNAAIRARALTHLAVLHPEPDSALNEQQGQNSGGRITKETGLLCLVIKTNEELMIARETARFAP